MYDFDSYSYALQFKQLKFMGNLITGDQ